MIKNSNGKKSAIARAHPAKVQEANPPVIKARRKRLLRQSSSSETNNLRRARDTYCSPPKKYFKMNSVEETMSSPQNCTAKSLPDNEKPHISNSEAEEDDERNSILVTMQYDGSPLEVFSDGDKLTSPKNSESENTLELVNLLQETFSEENNGQSINNKKSERETTQSCKIDKLDILGACSLTSPPDVLIHDPKSEDTSSYSPPTIANLVQVASEINADTHKAEEVAPHEVKE